MNIRKYNYNRWNLAFFKEQYLDDVIGGNYSSIHWMRYSFRDRWFADPFILNVSENYITLLVEELKYRSNKGRIAKLVVDRHSWELLEMKIILELGTHLSFPMILRRNDDIIIIPENSASGKSIAYKFEPSFDELIKINEVCNEPLTDATILDYGDKSYLLSTSVPTSNGDELSIFSFDEQNLTAKKQCTYKFDSNIARNAGSPYIHNGVLYRPAQDCNGSYGRGVLIQEIGYDKSTDSITFETRGQIYPFTHKYHLGIHTLNCYDGMCVIDARGLLYPIVGRLMRSIINFIKR